MASPVIQFKRGLLANLPGLRAGEPGFTTDSYDLYVGLTSETATNQIVGSGRFWTNNTTTTGSGVNLVEGTDNGTSFITLKSPDSLSGIVTYTMPGTDGSNGDVLTTNGSGTLSFSAPAASSFTIAGDTGSDTFSTGGTLTFTGGEGIDTAITDDTVTVSAEIASASNAGIASFSASYFSVTGGGDVSIGNAEADGSTKGIAAFNTDDFDASSGVISLGDSANGAVLAINGTTDEIEVSRTNGTVTIGLPNNVVVGGGLTATTFTLAGVAVTAILDEDAMTSDRADALATQQSIKAYVDTTVGAVDLTITTAEGTNGTGGGGGSVATSQTMTFAGTTNEIDVTVSGQSVTYGLPNDVTVANNLTVTGNLYVNGSTTQVNTSTTTIEDQLLDLGFVDGSAPSSDLNKDIGVLFNYYTDSAKKAAIYWDDSTSRVVVSSDVSESSGVLTNTTGGALEVASLYVSGCTGTADEVIGCSGGTIVITNATIDGGSF